MKQSKKIIKKPVQKKAKKKTSLHANVSPCIYSWVGAGAGRSGIGFNYTTTYDGAATEIYLDRGKGFPTLNKERFDELLKNKKEIEAKFGGELSWERLDTKRASRMAFRIKDAGLKDKEKWPELQDKMIDAMIRLSGASKNFIERLK